VNTRDSCSRTPPVHPPNNSTGTHKQHGRKTVAVKTRLELAARLCHQTSGLTRTTSTEMALAQIAQRSQGERKHQTHNNNAVAYQATCEGIGNSPRQCLHMCRHHHNCYVPYCSSQQRRCSRNAQRPCAIPITCPATAASRRRRPARVAVGRGLPVSRRSVRGVRKQAPFVYDLLDRSAEASFENRL
jgi:hypothetical protein